jgi:putative FmdB family regulatory protein
VPIYEYVCTECACHFEQLRPLSQADKTAECPRCHQAAKRKMSTFACYTTTSGGVPKTIPGTGGSSCSSCNSGNCSSCAS